VSHLSLKWRIAAAYAVLLILVLAGMSGVIAWRLQAILFDEARERVNTTMNDIAQRVTAAHPLGIPEFAPETFAQLFSSSNLVLWESPSTFIQVDNLSGYPIARTPNLGSTNIPPNNAITPSHEAAFRTIGLNGRPFLVEDRLFHSGNAAAIVHVAQPLDALYRTFEQGRQAIVLILLAGAVAVVVLSFAIASQAIGPIAQLSQAMREVGSERLDVRLATQRHDEIGELTASFNDLLARLEEAFARERQFISDASHELKTPLTSINANAQLLIRWGDRDEAVRRESLETIARESAALADMVNGMLTLAKADRGDDVPKEPLSLGMVTAEAVRGAQQRASEKGLALEFERPERSPLVEGSEHLLRQMIGNLIDNAIKFTPSGAVHVRVGGDGAKGWVEVADTGPGIPEAELGSVFERFYRADRAHSRNVPGTGLGLAIVRSIARVHGGSVMAGRAPEGGALMRVELPTIEESLTESS
jgi:signal transduction histidine kinase